MSFEGVIHKDHHGVVWFDDVPVTRPEDVPRRKAWANTVWYHTATVHPTDLARLLGPDDEAYGPQPGKAVAWKLACEPKGSLKIYDSRVWGVRSEDPVDTDHRLRYLLTEAKAADMRVSASAAMTALKAYIDRYDGRDGRPKLSQLPSRWRGMAHAALHGGPIVVCRGSSNHAMEIDRRGAYLEALMDEVPAIGKGMDGGSWVTYPGARWKDIRSKMGFADVTVHVKRDVLGEHAIPPLPIPTIVGSIRPTGVLRGVWTMGALTDAEERGEVEIVEVHQWCAVLDSRPLFLELANDFEALPKKLGKPLYTRFWGKLGSRGGFVGKKQGDVQDGQTLAAGLCWDFDGVQIESHEAPPHYRPDIAAFIADHNQRRVISAARRLDPKSIVAVHVDAIWTDDLEGANRLVLDGAEVGAWEHRAAGPLRFYAAGVYNHDGRLGASGYDVETRGSLTPKTLESWISGNAWRPDRLHMQGRLWNQDPAAVAESSSVSLDVEMDLRVSPVEGPGLYDEVWTSHGWVRKDADLDNL